MRIKRSSQRRTQGKRIRKSGGKTRKFKEMNCSPAANNSKDKALSNSCYSKEILYRIRNMYNKSNPDNKIISNDLNHIHSALKSRINTCESEDCWLKQLNNNDRNYLNSPIFAPYKPDEWKNNPNTWLSNFDITDVITQYEDAYPNFKFIGPTPIDFDSKIQNKPGKCVWNEMCNFSLKYYIDKHIDKIGIIFNLDTHDKSGSHWVSMFIDMKCDTIFYFDSASNPTPPEIIAFSKNVNNLGNQLTPTRKFKYVENYPNNHQMGNTECGMYSLFFIITMLENDKKNGMTSKKKYNLFKNGKISDKQVERFRSIYYN